MRWGAVSYGTVLISSFISSWCERKEKRETKRAPLENGCAFDDQFSPLSSSPRDLSSRRVKTRTVYVVVVVVVVVVVSLSLSLSYLSLASHSLCEIVVYSTDCYVLAYRLIYTRAAGLERLRSVVFLFRHLRPRNSLVWPLF